MSEPFLSEIRMFSFDFPPRGWAKCDGQLLAIAQNQALFSLLGTTFGGNGVQTFALPDLRSRVPLHMGASSGTSNRVLGERGGEENHTLTLSELPQHNHQVFVAGGATTGDPTNALLATPTTSKPYRTGAGDAVMPNLGPSGGNQPHTNIQPFLTVNFAIAMQGVFPSRS
ncbi:MAG TPA: tail fiber protein [Kofleriaceae bacterium]|nr:tail fiber protein [Kofleriaceae bacterium]